MPQELLCVADVQGLDKTVTARIAWAGVDRAAREADLRDELLRAAQVQLGVTLNPDDVASLPVTLDGEPVQIGPVRTA